MPPVGEIRQAVYIMKIRLKKRCVNVLLQERGTTNTVASC